MNRAFWSIDDIQDKYDIVYADPPWSYYGQQDKWGAAQKFYSTMKPEEIFKLPVPDLLSSRSIVFLWATSPKLDTALRCLEGWRLHYRGVAFVWVKTKKDGSPLKAQGVRPSIVKPLTEFVVCGSTVERGRPLRLYDESIVQTVFAPKQAHSAKPKEVYHRIESMYPQAKKLEMFARGKPRLGWDAFGDEVEELY